MSTTAALAYIAPPVGVAVALFALANATGPDYSVFLNYGIAGGVLLWFMFVVHPQLRRMEEQRHNDSIKVQESMDRVARSCTNLSLSLKIAAFEESNRCILTELDAADVARKEGEKQK